ncbi:unnamed protein product [Closterium sp. NIES-65]|nr:unnamed protein product [Closterium sp. NIES-65]
MATPSVLAFDAEGQAIDFDIWVDDMQLFLQCDRADSLSLFDLTSGASPAPAANADATDAVAARYSSPVTAALSRLMLRYLFPDLAAFPTVADLITHLRTSNIRYRAALPAEFCAKNPPPMYITLYYIVTQLPNSLRVVRDHFLSVCPTNLTVNLLEKALLAAEKNIVTVGASRGDPRTPIFEGCSPSLLLPYVASAATADLVGFESVGVASAPSGRRRTGKGKGGKGARGAGGGGGGGGGGSGGGGGGGGSGSGGGVTRFPDFLRVVRDHFVSVCPTTLTIHLLEKSLLAAEKSIVAVGVSRGDPRTPVFEGCSPSPLLTSVASAAAADVVGFESVGAASAPSGRRRTGKGKGAGGAGGGGGGGGGGSGGGGGDGGSGGEGKGVGVSSGGGGGGGAGGGSGGGGGGGGGGGSRGGAGGGGSSGPGRSSAQRSGSGGGTRQKQQRSRETLSPQQLCEWYAAHQRGRGTGPSTYVLRTGDRGGEQCRGPHSTQPCFGCLTDAWRHQFPEATEIPRWGELSRAGVAIFDLDFDAILAAMYAVAHSVEGDCYLCVPRDPGIEPATLCAG